SGGGRDHAAETWRSSFLRMPYTRDALARMSAIVETFETACTWDRVEDLYHDVRTDMGEAIRTVTGADGLVNCRFTTSTRMAPRRTSRWSPPAGGATR